MCEKNQTSNNMLYSRCIKDYHEELLQKFVITQNDKANGNIAAVCKRVYALTLTKEP